MSLEGRGGESSYWISVISFYFFFPPSCFRTEWLQCWEVWGAAVAVKSLLGEGGVLLHDFVFFNKLGLIGEAAQVFFSLCELVRACKHCASVLTLSSSSDLFFCRLSSFYSQTSFSSSALSLLLFVFISPSACVSWSRADRPVAHSSALRPFWCYSSNMPTITFSLWWPPPTLSPPSLFSFLEDEDVGPETTVGSLAGHQQSTYQIEKHIQVGTNPKHTHDWLLLFYSPYKKKKKESCWCTTPPETPLFWKHL